MGLGQPRFLLVDSAKGSFAPGAAPRQPGVLRIVQPVVQGSVAAGPCHFERAYLEEPVGREVAGPGVVSSQLHGREGNR